MEKVEKVYEKGPGFLRDVFQYLFPGSVFLFFIFLSWYSIDKNSLEANICFFLRANSLSVGFVAIILYLVFGYLIGLMVMELGDCFNCIVKCGPEKNETFEDEIRVADASAFVWANYIERYNLLFYTKRNLASVFFFIALSSAILLILLCKRESFFIYAIIVSTALCIIFIIRARCGFKDFSKRLKAALEATGSKKT
jgi:hypothetical protein